MMMRVGRLRAAELDCHEEIPLKMMKSVWGW